MIQKVAQQVLSPHLTELARTLKNPQLLFESSSGSSSSLSLKVVLYVQGEEKARRALALYARAAGSDTVLSEAEREDFSAQGDMSA